MLVPLAIGWLVGTAVGVAREERPNQPWWRSSLHWTNLQQRTPTAWHHLFDQKPSGLVRCKLRSGGFVGGADQLPDFMNAIHEWAEAEAVLDSLSVGLVD